MMTALAQFGLLQGAALLLIVTILVRPLGIYLSRVFSGQATALDWLMRPIERGIYRVSGVEPDEEMNWQEYAWAFVRFGMLGTIGLFLILRMQASLPWHFPAWQTTPLTIDLAANTAVSFATTTTWQAYAGEITMSAFSQMAGLTAQNFLAGAGGLAVGIAFMRGASRCGFNTLGNSGSTWCVACCGCSCPWQFAAHSSSSGAECRRICSRIPRSR